MKKTSLYSIIGALILFTQAFAFASSSRSERYQKKFSRSLPATVDYNKGRTWRKAYHKDINTLYRKSESTIRQRCTHPDKALRNFDYSLSSSFRQNLSQKYFSDPNLKEFNVMAIVNIPLQKIFVLDRKQYKQSGQQDGLKYAWRTSTGYHDKHFAYSRRHKKVVYGQKGAVSVYYSSKEKALKKLKRLARKKGAKLEDNGSIISVTFKDSGKKVVYRSRVSKVSIKTAKKQKLDLSGLRPNEYGFYRIRRHILSYYDYFHTQPGHYIVRYGAFSSRHLSGESDGGVNTEEPYMSWGLFFNLKRGMASHGAAYRNTLGSTGSHGCVRLLEENACRLFHLAGNTKSLKMPAIDQDSGQLVPGTTYGHRAIYIVQDKLDSVQKRFKYELIK